MVNYDFIEQLFKNVLSKSKAIQGRFFVSKKGGKEINSDTLEMLINDCIGKPKGAKYPLAMMMPPVSSGNYGNSSGEWDKYRITLLFLTTTHATGSNQLKALNKNTQTSTYSVLNDWSDMKRCAVSFVRVLNKLQRNRGLKSFRLAGDTKVIEPISMIGLDVASGVALHFTAETFIGCSIEDYTADAEASIEIPIS